MKNFSRQGESINSLIEVNLNILREEIMTHKNLEEINITNWVTTINNSMTVKVNKVKDYKIAEKILDNGKKILEISYWTGVGGSFISWIGFNAVDPIVSGKVAKEQAEVIRKEEERAGYNGSENSELPGIMMHSLYSVGSAGITCVTIHAAATASAAAATTAIATSQAAAAAAASALLAGEVSVSAAGAATAMAVSSATTAASTAAAAASAAAAAAAGLVVIGASAGIIGSIAIINSLSGWHTIYFNPHNLYFIGDTIEEAERNYDKSPEELLQAVNLFGKGTSDYIDNPFIYDKFFNEYYSEGIEKILKLRISEAHLTQNVNILDGRYLLFNHMTSAENITYKTNEIFFENNNSIVCVPYNIELEHWVGLIFEKDENKILIKYIDPENKPIPEILINDLIMAWKSIGYAEIKVLSVLTDTQRSNNCGPEVIEGFMEYLTGYRVPQEEAVLYHSQLLEEELLGDGIFI